MQQSGSKRAEIRRPHHDAQKQFGESERYEMDLDRTDRGGSEGHSPPEQYAAAAVDEARTEESKRGCNSEVNVKRDASQDLHMGASSNPFEAAAEARQVDSLGMGTWQDAKAEEIEGYLLGSQRKFIKYKLNIFYLNKVSVSRFLH